MFFNYPKYFQILLKIIIYYERKKNTYKYFDLLFVRGNPIEIVKFSTKMFMKTFENV